MKITFLGALAIAFIVLKLTEYIKWSWLWVLSPIWIPASIGIAIVAFLFFMKIYSKYKGI